MARNFKIDVNDRVSVDRLPGGVAPLGGLVRFGTVVEADGDGAVVQLDALGVLVPSERMEFRGEDWYALRRVARRRGARS